MSVCLPLQEAEAKQKHDEANGWRHDDDDEYRRTCNMHRPLTVIMSHCDVPLMASPAVQMTVANDSLIIERQTEPAALLPHRVSSLTTQRNEAPAMEMCFCCC